MKLCRVFSLESAHRGDFLMTIINIKKEISLNYPKTVAMEFCSKGLNEWVRNSRGKRAISVLIVSQIVIRSMFSFKFK